MTTRNKVEILACPNGHTVEVQPWGKRPASCPACVHGIPCGGPLMGRRASSVGRSLQSDRLATTPKVAAR